MPLIIIGIIALLFAFAMTNFLVKYFTKLNIVDRPDFIRKYHKTPTPTGAGIAFVIIMILTLILLIFNFISATLAMFFLPAFIIISFISFLDDLYGVPIVIRFISHILCASISAYFFFSYENIFTQKFSQSIQYLVLIGSFVAYINIYNFLDGMDGLTLSQSVHLSLTALIISAIKYDGVANLTFIITILAVILGTSLGMLFFNLPPAKIFLGDVGSISLGFCLGLCYITIALSSIELFIASIIANLYYIADGVGTILIRIYNREKIWQAHFKHFFQKAISKGKSVKTILKTIVSCNVSLMLFSILALAKPLIALLLAIISVTLTIRILTN